MHPLRFERRRGYLWVAFVAAGVALMAMGRTLPGLNLLVLTGFAAAIQHRGARRGQANLAHASLTFWWITEASDDVLHCYVRLFPESRMWVRSARISVVGYEAEDDVFAPEYGKQVEFRGRVSQPRFLEPPGPVEVRAEVKAPRATAAALANDADVRWALHVVLRLGADVHPWSAYHPLELSFAGSRPGTLPIE